MPIAAAVTPSVAPRSVREQMEARVAARQGEEANAYASVKAESEALSDADLLERVRPVYSGILDMLAEFTIDAIVRNDSASLCRYLASDFNSNLLDSVPEHAACREALRRGLLTPELESRHRAERESEILVRAFWVWSESLSRSLPPDKPATGLHASDPRVRYFDSLSPEDRRVLEQLPFVRKSR
jgi:hypothetical protein